MPRTTPSTGCVLSWKVAVPEAKWGDVVVAVGAAAALGAWDPEQGVKLTTGPPAYPDWFGRMWLGEAGSAWKLAIKRADGSVTWEAGCNRLLPKPRRDTAWGLTVMILHARFGRPEEPLAAEQASIEVDASSGLGWSTSSTPKSTECPPTPVEGQCLLTREKPMMRRNPSFISTCSTTDHCMDLCIDNESPAASSEVPWLWSGAHQIPKVGGRCEDAFFIGSTGLGVSDGVGSLAKPEFQRHGVDPAVYAKELMQLAEYALQQAALPSARGERAAEEATADALAASALSAAEREATTYGAATATVINIKGFTIGAANLGDSGFMVLRRAAQGFQIISRSREQQHGWNYPYQLSRLPHCLVQRLSPDTPRDTAANCERYQVIVQPGDLVLVFTDGIIDNLHNTEIIDIVEQCDAYKNGGSHSGLCDPFSIASNLARGALEKSLDGDADTPFAVASRRQGRVHIGGKGDDITVAAAWVMPPSPSAPRMMA